MLYAPPESVPENEMHQILLGFEIQTDHLISARRPDLVIINKKKKGNLPKSWLCGFGWLLGGTESKQKEI